MSLRRTLSSKPLKRSDFLEVRRLRGKEISRKPIHCSKLGIDPSFLSSEELRFYNQRKREALNDIIKLT